MGLHIDCCMLLDVYVCCWFANVGFILIVYRCLLYDVGCICGGYVLLVVCMVVNVWLCTHCCVLWVAY